MERLQQQNQTVREVRYSASDWMMIPLNTLPFQVQFDEDFRLFFFYFNRIRIKAV
jgi:hypothetical protein